MGDDICGVLIVAANVAEDRFDSLKIWWVGIEIKFSSFGIAQDRSQWLVEFMRNGSRKRARCSTSVEMNDFRKSMT